MFLKYSLSSIFSGFEKQALTFKYLLTIIFPTEQVGNRYNKIYSSSSSSESEDEEGEEEHCDEVSHWTFLEVGEDVVEVGVEGRLADE
mgnify:CR=1 FL=1